MANYVDLQYNHVCPAFNIWDHFDLYYFAPQTASTTYILLLFLSEVSVLFLYHLVKWLCSSEMGCLDFAKSVLQYHTLEEANQALRCQPCQSQSAALYMTTPTKQ